MTGGGTAQPVPVGDHPRPPGASAVLTLSCPDRTDVDGLRSAFTAVGAASEMDWQLRSRAEQARVVVLVSRPGHCLNDLLYRHSTGALRAELAAVVSNHPDFRGLVEAYGVPFVHIPVPAGGKAEAESRLLELVRAERAELVVLARYMQVLSGGLCAALPDTINIHHSFLPSFVGARPYHQAYERGVKLIGATAHYVTAELDEGPIIEQEVARATTRRPPTGWSRSVGTSSASRWPAPSAGTWTTGCCATVRGRWCSPADGGARGGRPIAAAAG